MQSWADCRYRSQPHSPNRVDVVHSGRCRVQRSHDLSIVVLRVLVCNRIPGYFFAKDGLPVDNGSDFAV